MYPILRFRVHIASDMYTILRFRVHVIHVVYAISDFCKHNTIRVKPYYARIQLCLFLGMVLLRGL